MLITWRLKDGLYVFNPHKFLDNSSLRVKLNSCSMLSFANSSIQPCYLANKSRALFTFSFAPLPCPSLSSIFTMWHNRLGLPSSSIVKTVMSSYNVQNYNKIDSSFVQHAVLARPVYLPFHLLWMNIQLLHI